MKEKRSERKYRNKNKLIKRVLRVSSKSTRKPISCPLAQENDLTVAMAQTHTHDFLYNHYFKFTKIMLCGQVANKTIPKTQQHILHHPHITTVTTSVHIYSILSFTQYQNYTINSILLLLPSFYFGKFQTCRKVVSSTMNLQLCSPVVSILFSSLAVFKYLSGFHPL